MVLASLLFAFLAGEGPAQDVAGWTLIFSCCGSMLLAAAVLALTGRKYPRAAVTQGTTPLFAVVPGVLATLH